MIRSIKDDEGKVVSYIEFYLFNKDRVFDKKGEYIFVNECWAHETYRHLGLLEEYIQTILPDFPSVKFVYWDREKYNRRISLYEISRNGVMKLKKRRIK